MTAQALNDRAILRATFQSLTPMEREAFEERAAIMEHDGGIAPESANREALWNVVRQRRYAQR